jgi:hypothetical protein
MKKQLFYNFYVTRENFNGEVNNIHYKCLEYYKHVFDEVFINITLDEIDDVELIKMSKEKFLNIFDTCKKITFTVNKNDTTLCESVFFWEEILNKLNTLDLVFFAHNKGLTNLNNESYDRESILHWIIALYYGSLHEYDNAIKLLTFDTFLFCGSCLTSRADKFRFYSGTFFWLNAKRIYEHIHDYNIEVPKLCSRHSTENFPQHIDLCKHNVLTSSNNMFLYFGEDMFDWWYTNAVQYCEWLGYLNEDFYKLYNFAINNNNI